MTILISLLIHPVLNVSTDMEGENDNPSADNKGKSVDVSQARLDIVAFSKLASINHQRIRRVAASSWTFRATDFANRIVRSNFNGTGLFYKLLILQVRLMNVEEGSQSESLTDVTKKKLDLMVQPYFNPCVPLKPLLGALVMTKVEAVPKEKRARQPRATQEKVWFN